MSREIKYKVWNKRLNKMFRVYSINFDLDLIQCESENGAGHTFGFIDCELLQYTGLKDKNGKEIFESDVIYLAGSGYCLVEFPFADLYDAAAEGDIGEIKGNIHESPELLEQP